MSQIFKKKAVLCLNELKAKKPVSRHTLTAHEGPAYILSIPFESVKDAVEVSAKRIFLFSHSKLR